MKNLKFLFALFFITALFSCGSVQTDYDRSVNFSKYKTYNYFTDMETGAFNELDIRRLTTAVDQQMAQKGFTRSESPDLLIDIRPSVRDYKSTSSTVRVGGGNWGRGVSVGGSVGIPIRTKKTDRQIVIEMVDASNDHMIWQGIYDKTTSPNADNEKVINDAVAKIFSKFPPE